MGKQEFLTRLREALSGLPQDEIAGRVSFYSEMIDDRVEEGLTEEAAIGEIESVEAIAAQALAEVPLPKLVKERVKPTRQLRWWEILLIILGFPVWFPLLTAAFFILLSVYVVLWSLLLSLWAVDLSLAVGCLGGLAAGFLLPDRSTGLLTISAAMILAGLSILLFFGCKAATKGTVLLTKQIALGVKSLFLRKETEQ